MQRHDFASVSPPPDLLRRFVPTPFKAIYRIGEVPVIVQTNDAALLPTFPLESGFVKPGEELFEWKVVRDVDVHGQLEQPVILDCGALEVVQMGPACLLALDRERRELLGFIGAGVDGKTYQEYLVSFMRRMTEKTLEARLTANVESIAMGSNYE